MIKEEERNEGSMTWLRLSITQGKVSVGAEVA